MVKPDGVRRGLVGRILARFEDKGFRLAGLRLRLAPEELVRRHYAELADRPFFGSLLAYLGSGPVVCLCLAMGGPVDADGSTVAAARALIGPTDPSEAPTGTIRGDFGLERGANVVHGSDSAASAEREIALWFDGDEMVDLRQPEKERLNCKAPNISFVLTPT